MLEAHNPISSRIDSTRYAVVLLSIFMSASYKTIMSPFASSKISFQAADTPLRISWCNSLILTEEYSAAIPSTILQVWSVESSEIIISEIAKSFVELIPLFLLVLLSSSLYLFLLSWS